MIFACIPDTTSPGTDDQGSSRAEAKTVPGRTSRESHPSEDLSELPLTGQEYQRWCCHRKTDRPRSAFWTVGPAPHLTCRFHADTCTGGSSRSLQCRCPFSIFTRHTNGCISVSGYSLRKVHEKASSGARKSSPHYLSSFASLSGTKPQKLPIMSNNILSFDRIFLRCLLTPLWVSPIRFA